MESFLHLLLFGPCQDKIYLLGIRPGSTQTVRPKKLARNLLFRIRDVEEFYYLCSEIADLRHCFDICKDMIFMKRPHFLFNKNDILYLQHIIEKRLFVKLGELII